MPSFLPRVVITALANLIPVNLPIIQQMNPPIPKLRTWLTWPIDINHIQFARAMITIIQLKITVIMFKCFCDGHHFGSSLSLEHGKRVVLCCTTRPSAPLSAAVTSTTTKNKTPNNIFIRTSFIIFCLPK